MRKTLVTIALALTLLVSGSVTAASNSDINIFVSGREIHSDVPPQIIDGRTMVPIRAAAEALGANVRWDEESRSVHINFLPQGPSFAYKPWANQIFYELAQLDFEGREISNLDPELWRIEIAKQIVKRGNLLREVSSVVPPQEAQEFHLVLAKTISYGILEGEIGYQLLNKRTSDPELYNAKNVVGKERYYLTGTLGSLHAQLVK